MVAGKKTGLWPICSEIGNFGEKTRPSALCISPRNSLAEPDYGSGVQELGSINTSPERHEMKKIFAIVAIAIMASGATTATARTHHRHHHYWSLGFRGSNAELRGNNANSASGSNSLANPKNAAGIP